MKIYITLIGLHKCNLCILTIDFVQYLVRIYVDAVINHMTGGGSGVGSNGSYFDGDKEDFPGVPFSAWDFHGRDVCYTHDLEVHDYNNAQEVRKRVTFKVVRIF